MLQMIIGNAERLAFAPSSPAKFDSDFSSVFRSGILSGLAL
jgi:hypothetical protein